MSYDVNIDGPRSYDLAHTAIRETCIRSGSLRPDPFRPDEMRWAAEGPRPARDLDSVRKPLDGRCVRR